jgi:hypothetical protein
MPDKEIQELCRRIYRKHRAALDLIYEHRPDRPAEIRTALLSMIEADPDFLLDHSSKDWIRFLPNSWKGKADLQKGQGWTRSGMILLFQFVNSSRFNPNSLAVNLCLGPGESDVRQKICDAALSASSPFDADAKGVSRKWVRLLWQDRLAAPDYDDLDLETALSRIEEAWQNFKSNDLPLVMDVIDRALS